MTEFRNVFETKYWAQLEHSRVFEAFTIFSGGLSQFGKNKKEYVKVQICACFSQLNNCKNPAASL